jgi:ribose transport system substrate-binding protein
MHFDQGAWITPIRRPLKFVFIPKSLHPWYDEVKQGAQKAIEEYTRHGLQIEMTWDAPRHPDMEEHAARVKTYTPTRPDGIAIACHAPATDTQIIDEAVEAGLHVITFDTDAPKSQRQTFIGHSGDYQDGCDLAEFLRKQLHYGAKVGILSGTLAAPNHTERVRGFKEKIAQFKDIRVVFERPDNDEIEKAAMFTDRALKTHPDISGFFCCNATNPIGCARAVKAAGKAGQVHIVGMDALPETVQCIREGVIDGVKMQRQWEIGYWAIMYMVAINQGHTIPAEHLIGSVLVTQDEVYKP